MTINLSDFTRHGIERLAVAAVEANAELQAQVEDLILEAWELRADIEASRARVFDSYRTTPARISL